MHNIVFLLQILVSFFPDCSCKSKSMSNMFAGIQLTVL